MRVHLEDSKVSGYSWLRRETNVVQSMINERVFVGFRCRISQAYIGEGCQIASRTIIGKPDGKPIHIGPMTWIGAQVEITEGVSIGEGCVIGAGGNGTRLYPLTAVASKHLMSVYDKPMIYYPLSTLMLSGIKEIILISTPHDIPLYQRLLGDGSRFGISLTYKVQDQPNGIAQAFLLAEDFIGDDSMCLILGDNIFYGDGLTHTLQTCAELEQGAIVFGYHVQDPERYGVVEFDKDFSVKSLEEKPQQPKSNYAVPGLYFYDNQVVEFTKKLKPSARGELEITDVNIEYLKRQQLKLNLMGRGCAWLDTGTPESLLSATNFVGTIEQRQGYKIACLEEIAYRMGFMGLSDLEKVIRDMPKSTYKTYVQQIIDQEIGKMEVSV